MNISQALNVLNISTSEITQAVIKKAYKVASLKYHPDKNPAGAEMMKAVNEAYNTLKKAGEKITVEADFVAHDFGQDLNDMLNELLKLAGLEIEVCGSWIWIFGDTKQHRKSLGKDGLGCFYASKKKAWYYRPSDYKSKNRKSMDMDSIRGLHGSSKVKTKTVKALAA